MTQYLVNHCEVGECTPKEGVPKQGSGFTLIETLVAIAILALAVVGPLYTAERSIVAAQIARSQLTASYLAQEGVEYVRARRDDAYLSAYHTTPSENISVTSWASFLSTFSACRSGTCIYDPGYTLSSGYQISACSSPTTCPPLYLASGIYTERYTDAEPTPYTRTIELRDAATDAKGVPTDVQVTSTVTWMFHNTPYTVQITDHLTPWQ